MIPQLQNFFATISCGGSVLERACLLSLMTQMCLSTLVPLRAADLSSGHSEAASRRLPPYGGMYSPPLTSIDAPVTTLE